MPASVDLTTHHQVALMEEKLCLVEKHRLEQSFAPIVYAVVSEAQTYPRMFAASVIHLFSVLFPLLDKLARRSKH